MQTKHADVLADVPTFGRSIAWDELDTAAFPLFGANLTSGIDAAALVAEVTVAADGAAARMEQHWINQRREAEAEARREALRAHLGF